MHTNQQKGISNYNQSLQVGKVRKTLLEDLLESKSTYLEF